MQLNHYAYCGMLVPIAEGREDEVRREAARVLRRRRRQGFPVVRLSRHRWEVQEPEDCGMVPDMAGVLKIEE